MNEQILPPLVVTGPPRSGTTLLAGLLNLHPEVGPKPEVMLRYKDPETFLRSEGFGPWSRYQQVLERHDVWKTVFATTGGFRDLHRQVRIHRRIECPAAILWRELLEDVRPGERLLVKNPELVFALPAVRRFFVEDLAPGGAGHLLICVRDPVEIFASVYSYRMFSAPPIEAFRLESPTGIDLFRRRLVAMYEEIWNAAKRSRTLIVPHDALVRDPVPTMRHVCRSVGLPFDPARVPPVVPRPHELVESRLHRDTLARVARELDDLTVSHSRLVGDYWKEGDVAHA